MPKHPSNDPVFFFHAIDVSAEVIDYPCFGSRHSVDSKNLSVCDSLADLSIAVRRTDGGVASKCWYQDVLAFCHSSSSLYGFLLLVVRYGCVREG